MRILITGAGGFVGGHLSDHLLKTIPDAELHGTVLPGEEAVSHAELHAIDLKDEHAVNTLIEQLRPDYIFHLAAQAFVPRSFIAPWETLENNIRAQLNVIQACLAADIRPRILVVSSAEIYGTVSPDELPLTEDAELRPTSPYSVSKIAQDMLALQYYISHNLPIMRARPFNHFGPGQRESFVAPSFASQIARIEAGQQLPQLNVGDLTAQRDFTDVRDIVRAYRLIVEHGKPGEVYNIASGQARSIQSLLDGLMKHSRTDIEVIIDPERLRPSSIPILQGDASRLHAATGWRPLIPFEQTLADVLNDCRQRVSKEG